MKLLDFHRSFFFFEVDFVAKPPKTVSDSRQNQHNRARIRIDCRCQITRPNRKTTEYYLGEACKTERCGWSKKVGLFIQPNADFRAVYSTDELIIFKSWDKNNKGVMLIPRSLGPQPERQVIRTEDTLYKHRLLVRYVNATPLTSVKQIIAANDAGRPLIARTAFTKAGHRVVLDYPRVTLNVKERHAFYQTDTGPIIYPELTRNAKHLGESFRLAFSAFNGPDWIELIVQKPTPIGKGLSVNHYSQKVQIDGCKNTIFAE